MVIERRHFTETIDKAPDVLVGEATCHTHSIDVGSTNTVRPPYLVASDPPTHLVILLTTSAITESLTDRCSVSPTHSVWGGDLLPHGGTLLGGIGHIEIRHTSPSRPTTRMLS